jgi:hypothetical protein
MVSVVGVLAVTGSCRTDQQSINDVSHITQSVAAITPTTVVLSPMADTRLNLDAVNYSIDTLLTLYTWPDAKVANAVLMKFDLSSIPAGATVSSATLSLYQTAADATTEPTYTATLHRIINKNPNLAQATGWTYDGVQGWTSNTCCSGGVPMAQADISAPVDTRSLDKTNGIKQWTVTSLIQGWLNTPSTNFGLLINSDASKLADHWRYFSSNEHTLSQRPSLSVTYTTASGPWPNEPPGLTTIEETGWEDGTLGAWQLINPDTGCLVKYITVEPIPTSIPASPIQESKMLQIFYPQRHCGGGGHEAAYTFPSPRNEVFVGYYVQVNDTWQGHESAINKMIYVFNGTPNGFSAMWYEMYGARSDPLRLYLVSNLPTTQIGYGPTTEERFPRGQWHKVEIYQKQGTSNNGIVSVWVDGVLAMNRSDVVTGNAPVSAVRISGIWGGVGDSKLNPDYMRFDHIRISGR